MKVLIDGHMIGSNEGGNERYTKNLFLFLVKNVKKNISVIVGKQGEGFKGKGVIINETADNNIFRLIFLIPRIVKNEGIDIVHSNYISPFYKNAKFVVTVHDFCFKYFPKYFSLRERLIFRYLLPYSLKLSDYIIVPSEFTKEELLRFYPQYAKKTAVIYEAAEDIFHYISREKADKEVEKSFKLNSSFLLAINGRNPKKNINMIIKAYIKIQKLFPGLKLVIVGGEFNIDRKYFGNKGIILLKNINDEQLNFLYNAATIFIYFSVYEGFGLPILEALRCKTLVICSDIDVHREIAKDFVTFANPYKAGDLAEKIELLLKDKAYAEKMRRNSSKINKLYSWSKTAKETFKVYTFLG